MTFRLLLLLQTLAAFLFCQAGSTEIKVEEYTNAIKLSCPDGQIKDQYNNQNNSMELLYKDENTGKYECVKDSATDSVSAIFVKFRTCDNCVEFDMTSIVSILVGNLVATTGIGVAVYLVASQTQTSRGPSKKKSNPCSHTHLRLSPVHQPRLKRLTQTSRTSRKDRSDKQQLVPNEVSNDQYQPLNLRNQDLYDKIKH